jgi:hypothetical protein
LGLSFFLSLSDDSEVSDLSSPLPLSLSSVDLLDLEEDDDDDPPDFFVSGFLSPSLGLSSFDFSSLDEDEDDDDPCFLDEPTPPEPTDDAFGLEDVEDDTDDFVVLLSSSLELDDFDLLLMVELRLKCWKVAKSEERNPRENMSSSMHITAQRIGHDDTELEAREEERRRREKIENMKDGMTSFNPVDESQLVEMNSRQETS